MDSLKLYHTHPLSKKHVQSCRSPGALNKTYWGLLYEDGIEINKGAVMT